MTQDTLATTDDTELGQLRRACASYVEVLAARDEELKTLRGKVKEWLDLAIDHCVVIEQQHAEIERLRGLLRDYMTMIMGSSESPREEWLRRVLEAIRK